VGTITILRSNLLIACIIQENQNLLDESREGRQNRSLVSFAAQTSESVCGAKRRCDGMDKLWCLHRSEGYGVHIDERSSYKERKGNALASGADEGRDKLR
jgi:hypothetical protein